MDPNVLTDGISVIDAGVDSGKSPLLVKQNQLSFAVNTDLRGGFLKPRPGVNKITLTYPNSLVETRQKSGFFQVAGYYKPDVGPESLLASIGGRQFRFNVGSDNSVQEITIQYVTNTTADFVPPAISGQVTISVSDTSKLSPNADILVNGKPYTVITVNSATSVTIENLDDDGSINPVPSGSQVISYDPNPSNKEQAWEVQAEKWWILQDGQSLPIIYDGVTSRRADSQGLGGKKEVAPGKMMAYGIGRLWESLPDDRSFRAGDIVGSSSGTAAENFRDAVLKQTENQYLTSGDFRIPISGVGIRAMRFVSTLDSSLGQGPLQILTPNTVFSVNAPVDSLTWQQMTNPIQTISMISYGGLSHYGSILVNGDLFYRALDGIRSLILARRDFNNSWGNTPISREMNRVITLDDTNLLSFSSAQIFDNRFLMTASPFRTSHGIIHRGWMTIDFDLLSSIRQKAEPVYESLGIGLNILQIVKGEFNGVERCFAFGLNAEDEIELYEFTKNDKFDHNETLGPDIPINWIVETGSVRFNSAIPPEPKILKQLNNLILEIGNLIGTVNFKVYFKPDSHPCWILWKEFSECAKYESCTLDPVTGCQTIHNYKPQFRPRLSLGQPPTTCDPLTNRPYRHGYSFQIRLEISGYCEIKSLNLYAERREETMYGVPVGC